jgi:hypothetical protein
MLCVFAGFVRLKQVTDYWQELLIRMKFMIEDLIDLQHNWIPESNALEPTTMDWIQKENSRR